MATNNTGGIRFLAGLALLMLVVGTGFGVLTIAQAVTGKGRDTIAVHQQVSGHHLEDLPPSVVQPTQVNVTSELRHASRSDKWLVAGRDILPILFGVALAFLARSILKSARDGDPFTERNVTRLRAIGFLCLIGLPLVTVAESAFNASLSSSLANGLFTSTNLSFTGPFISIGVFALAELFAYGVRLRMDVEGTV